MLLSSLGSQVSMERSGAVVAQPNQWSLLLKDVRNEVRMHGTSECGQERLVLARALAV